MGWDGYSEVAERLDLDSKVLKIRGEINENRISVDAVRFEQWALDNLTPLIKKFERAVSVLPPSLQKGPVSKRRADPSMEKLTAASDYWLRMACAGALREFCHNRIFGIDSYLSRRIRHGTLAGTLIAPIEGALSKFRQRYSDTLSENDYEALAVCSRKYASAVDSIRDEMLHFRNEDHPKAVLLPAEIDTTERLLAYIQFHDKMLEHLTLGYNPKELSSMFTEYCWDVLAEDLSRVQYQLRIFFNQTVRPILRDVSKDGGDSLVWKQLAKELDQTSERLFTDLSLWFTRSEDATMTVSVRELLNVVLEEVGEYWPVFEKRLIIERGGDERLFGVIYQAVYDLLSVFISNIAQHGDPKGETLVRSEFLLGDSSIGNALRVAISSPLKSGARENDVTNAIQLALRDDPGRDPMVTEGRSGLAKAQVLIMSYARGSNFSWKVHAGHCRVEFTIPVVVVGAAR